MKTVTSVSGGRTSAYLAANYPSDALVFALVRIEDEKCRFKDEPIRRLVEDRIQAPFIATAEDDLIIYTILDLEQFFGKEINWVTGPTYDAVIKKKGGYLPNKMQRFCTTKMKLEPIFNWWLKTFGIFDPVIQNIGYRANEVSRANTMLGKADKNGFVNMRATLGKYPNGRNKWTQVPFQRPAFPLIEDGINKDAINKYWLDKPVRFAPYNNCVGCFHRNPVFLKYMFQEHPEKMSWFKGKEDQGAFWKSEVRYAEIENSLSQIRLYETDFSDCDSGFCGI